MYVSNQIRFDQIFIDRPPFYISSDLLALGSLSWVEPGKYSVGNWPNQTSSNFPYASAHPAPPHAHTNFMSNNNPSSVTASFGQTYYPPTPPKDLPHDSLLDPNNKQQDLLNNKNYQYHSHHQNLFPNTTSPTTSAAAAAAAAAAYHHHSWGHVLKDPAVFWSTMKSPQESPGKMSNNNQKKKPSQGQYKNTHTYKYAETKEPKGHV